MKNHSFLKETAGRLKAKTPTYWKRVRRICIWAVTGATAVITADATMELGLPEWVDQALKYVIAGGTFLGFGAQLTKEDNESN